MLPNVVELLKSILPLRVEPNSYVFTDGQGEPIDQSEFARGFQAVLRVLKIRQRPVLQHAAHVYQYRFDFGMQSKVDRGTDRD